MIENVDLSDLVNGAPVLRARRGAHLRAAEARG